MLRIVILCALCAPALIAAAVKIPKSSLQAVRNSVASKLKEAEQKKDQRATNSLKKELVAVDAKIKKFELEWLQYRKHQLEAKEQTPELISQINEIETLVKARQ